MTDSTKIKKTKIKKTIKNMPKKAKKKAVPKMAEVIKPYATLTEEQYDELKSFMLWDNPMTDLSSISTDSDANLLEIIFQLGKIYKSFEVMFEKMTAIMTQIEPEDDGSHSSYDWDNDEEEEDTTDENEEEENN